MSVIKRSKLIDKIEYTIYGADAEMVFKVLNGNMLYKLLGKCSDIEDKMFKSLNNNERISYIAASDMSVEILKKVLGINIGNLYDVLKNFENSGEFYREYREHVVHQWRVFILGLYFMEAVPEIAEMLQQKYDNDFIETWAITALCHDIGYLLERCDINNNNFAIDIVDFLNSLEENQTGLSVFCPELDLTNLLPAEMDDIIRTANIRKYNIQSWKQLFQDRDHNNSWKLEILNNNLLNFENYYRLTTSLETKAGNRPLFIDHGVASVAILVYLMERKDHWIKQVSNLDKYGDIQDRIYLKQENKYHACCAIALHNVSTLDEVIKLHYPDRGFEYEKMECNDNGVIDTGKGVRIYTAYNDHTVPTMAICSEVEELPFQDNSYNVVVSRQCLHYVENVERALDEVKRILKPNGIFILAQIVPFDKDTSSDWESIIKIRQPLRKWYFTSEEWNMAAERHSLFLQFEQKYVRSASVGKLAEKYSSNNMILKYKQKLLSMDEEFKRKYAIIENSDDVTYKSFWHIAKYSKNSFK